MKIVIENNIRWLTVENDDNFLYDIEQNTVIGKRLIPAKSITDKNVTNYFKEITQQEAEKLNENDNIQAF